MASRCLIERGQPRAKLLHPRHVGIVTDKALNVIVGEFPLLTFQTDLVKRDGTLSGPEHGHDLGDAGLVEPHPSCLCQDRRLPDLVAVAGHWSPSLTWARMELAVPSVGEGAIAPDTTTTTTLQEAG